MRRSDTLPKQDTIVQKCTLVYTSENFEFLLSSAALCLKCSPDLLILRPCFTLSDGITRLLKKLSEIL